MRALNDSNFDLAIKEAKDLILVDFWATWCGPCRMIAPVLEELDREMENVEICKVNVDENPALANRFGIEAIPTILFFRNGELVARKVGLSSKVSLVATIGDLLP